MARSKYYPPKERTYYYGNSLQCVDCGNTRAFSINLRIPYLLTMTSQGIQSEPDDKRLRRIFKSLGKNLWSLMDRDIFNGEQTIRCANCDTGFVDFQERLHDLCFHFGCPGCEVCGQYMSEVDVKEICSECLLEHDGDLTEEDCLMMCPWTADGLGEVRAHHDFTLEDLKIEMGYP